MRKLCTQKKKMKSKKSLRSNYQPPETSLAHHTRNFQGTAVIHSQGKKKKHPYKETGTAGCTHSMTEAIRSSLHKY